jgi:hypothetical protein
MSFPRNYMPFGSIKISSWFMRATEHQLLYIDLGIWLQYLWQYCRKLKLCIGYTTKAALHLDSNALQLTS